MLVTLVFKEFVVGMASFYSASLHATDPTSQDWFQPGHLARWIYVKKNKKKTQTHTRFCIYVNEVHRQSGRNMDDTEPGNTVMGKIVRSKSFPIHCLIHVNCLKALASRIHWSTFQSLYLLSFTCVRHVYYCHLWTSQSSVCFTSQTNQMCDFCQILVSVFIFGIKCPVCRISLNIKGSF